MKRLHDGFVRSSLTHADQPALQTHEETLTYRALRTKAAALAATLRKLAPAGGSPLVAVFASRTVTSYAGILGALMAGRGYVPLNLTFPVERTRAMLQRSNCRSVVVDAPSAAQLDDLLEGIASPLLILLPEAGDVSRIAERWPCHTVLGAGDLADAAEWTGNAPDASSPEAIAYLLFTSGSTGEPKAVSVTHRNATHFVGTMVNRYQITSDDRFSQMFDTTFDLSVFDMFVAWEKGACVCCPPARTLLNPDAFIRNSNLTVWFSVPSVGAFMKRFGVLKASRYPSLRVSLFCGEPLPTDVAEAWAAAAPNAVVENLYGPTELTVACAAYRWDAQVSPGESSLGIVPIGYPLDGLQAIVVSPALEEVVPGEIGELLMAGPQVTPGYWGDPEATARAYVTTSGRSVTFYRTGDRVRKPIGSGPLTFVGRTDQQVKVLGYRVELGEVESALRAAAGVSDAVALGWPLAETGPQGIVAFVTGNEVEPGLVREQLRRTLPSYAVPRDIRVLPEMPLNRTGKIDRPALLALLGA